MDQAYTKAILLNPRFWWRRLIRGVKTGEFFWDVYYAVTFFLKPVTLKAPETLYFAPEFWPQHDFESEKLTVIMPQIVRKTKQHHNQSV